MSDPRRPAPPMYKKIVRRVPPVRKFFPEASPSIRGRSDVVIFDDAAFGEVELLTEPEEVVFRVVEEPEERVVEEPLSKKTKKKKRSR